MRGSELSLSARSGILALVVQLGVLGQAIASNDVTGLNPADEDRSRPSFIPDTAQNEEREATDVELTPGNPTFNDVSSTGVTLDWLAPPSQLLSEPAAENITGYKVELSSGSGASKVVSVNGSAATNALVTGLLPKTKYDVSVGSILKNGRVVIGKPGSFETRASVPARTAIPSVTSISWRSVVLRWDPPNDHGEQIRDYAISVQVGGSGDFSPLVENSVIVESLESTATTRKIRDLHPGTVYRFKVAAINSLGKGPDSVGSKATSTRKAEVPDPPIGAHTKYPSEKAMTLFWKAPVLDNGARINAYRVFIQKDGEGPFLAYGDAEYGIGNLLKVDGGFSLRIKNLFAGQKYSFRIASVNHIGVGSQCEATPIMKTVAKVPSGFTNKPVIQNVGANSLDLSWEPPKRDGGAPITGYRILVSQGGGGFGEYVKDTGNVETFRKIYGLEYGGKAYSFQVQAINKLGRGERSPSSSVAITKDDRVAAATQSIVDEQGVRQIAEVRNQVMREKEVAVEESHKALIAVEAARHEKGLRSQKEKDIERLNSELKHQKDLCQRKSDASKQLQTREIASIQRLADEKIQSEKNLCRQQAQSQEETIQELQQAKAKLTEETVILESKAEQLEAKIIAMQNEGCKLGIKSWCRDD